MAVHRSALVHTSQSSEYVDIVMNGDVGKEAALSNNIPDISARDGFTGSPTPVPLVLTYPASGSINLVIILSVVVFPKQEPPVAARIFPPIASRRLSEAGRISAGLFQVADPRSADCSNGHIEVIDASSKWLVSPEIVRDR